MKLVLLLFCITFNGFYGIKAQTSGNSKEIVRSGSIMVDGSRLDYVVEGQGRPCLIIGSSIYYPKTFSTNLRKNLEMYFVDMKWFSKYYEPEDLKTVTIETIVEDVEEIRRKMGLEKPILLGHSIHGTIALEYAKRYYGNIEAVIAIGSPSEFGNEIFIKKTADLWESASQERKDLQKKNWGEITEIDRLTGKEATATAYHRAAPQYWYDPYYNANWLWDGMTVHTEVTNHLFGSVFADYNMFADHMKIPAPVLVAMGKYDYVIPYTLWESQYPSIADFKLILFKKSGHTPQLEQPDKFDKVLLKWLDNKNLLK